MASGTPTDSICSDGVAIVREFVAEPKSAARGRAVVRSFLDECSTRPEWVHEIVTAAGEALVNSIQHAYPPNTRGKIVLSIYCCTEHKIIAVQVRDSGKMKDGSDTPAHRGFGLLIMRALAETISIDTAGGTAVTMVFRK